jgi:Zn-dependent peptidase ImmA (M78 family)
MKPGTPGFVPSRLKEAMEARNVTAIALADMLGVSVAAVSHYTTGKHSPAPDVMKRISEVLNLPMHFFLRPSAEPSGGAKFARSLRTATDSTWKRANRRYGWAREIVSYLQEFIQFPAVNFPDFGVPSDPAKISDDDVERLASETRRFWNLGDGPISNVVWLLENNGAILCRYKLHSDKLDAFSQWDLANSTPYVVLGADKDVAARSRMDVAHELGHMVLHRRLDPVSLTRSEVYQRVESQANRFAGAFLLPERSFSEDFSVPSLDAFCALKMKWKVSIALMVMRSIQLGLANEEKGKRLWINRARRGWRTQEPLDDIVEPELPRFLPRSVQLLVEQRVVSRQDFPFQVALPASDIEELVGLRPGYFSEAEDPDPILSFPSNKRPNSGQANFG